MRPPAVFAKRLIFFHHFLFSLFLLLSPRNSFLLSLFLISCMSLFLPMFFLFFTEFLPEFFPSCLSMMCSFLPPFFQIFRLFSSFPYLPLFSGPSPSLFFLHGWFCLPTCHCRSAHSLHSAVRGVCTQTQTHTHIDVWCIQKRAHTLALIPASALWLQSRPWKPASPSHFTVFTLCSHLLSLSLSLSLMHRYTLPHQNFFLGALSLL